MSESHLFALGLALACLAGVRVYLTVLGVGLAGLFGWMELPSALAVTQSPWVLGTAGLLAVVEFFADKIPGVDSGWDLVHTVLRIPVGAFLAAATLSPDGELQAGALAVGAGAAFLSHTLKTGSRAMINASPEPASNWSASLAEDAASAGALALVFAHPWIALALLLTVLGVIALLLVWALRKLSRWVRGATPSAPSG